MELVGHWIAACTSTGAPILHVTLPLSSSPSSLPPSLPPSLYPLILPSFLLLHIFPFIPPLFPSLHNPSSLPPSLRPSIPPPPPSLPLLYPLILPSSLPPFFPPSLPPSLLPTPPPSLQEMVGSRGWPGRGAGSSNGGPSSVAGQSVLSPQPLTSELSSHVVLHCHLSPALLSASVCPVLSHHACVSTATAAGPTTCTVCMYVHAHAWTVLSNLLVPTPSLPPCPSLTPLPLPLSLPPSDHLSLPFPLQEKFNDIEEK